MQKFDELTGVAAPLPMINVDTDMIIPKQHLKTIKRTGLGKVLFDEMRFTPDGKEIPGFVLNKPAYRKAQILIAGRNFGCGSSREHAPWALLDFGIRCVIAPSFGDIFDANCAKNGLLTIALPADTCSGLRALLRGHSGMTLSVDLEAQTVTDAQGGVYRFDIAPIRKRCLINGYDDIARTQEYAATIAGFETAHRAAHPWMFTVPPVTR